jgi:hypothetical protein
MSQPRKVYYRWAYSPTTADVNVSHNEEGHPSDIRLHTDLANERPERDLIFGYGIRTPEGWNVFDEDHKAVTDPNILWSVRRGIEENGLSDL